MAGTVTTADWNHEFRWNPDVAFVGCNGVLAAGYNGMVLDRRILVIRRAAKAVRIAS